MDTRLAFALLFTLTFGLAPLPARAQSAMHAEYFVLPSRHPDVGHGVDGRIVTGLVEKRLGPNRLPVVTPFGRSYSGASRSITDVDAAHQLRWYVRGGTTGIRNVKSGTDRLPFAFERFFPPGKTSDGGTNGFLAVHWSGTFELSASKSIGFKLGSDDDSWVFVDGRLVVDNGGVKPDAVAPFTVAHLAPGTHAFDVFYADRHGAGAELDLTTDFTLRPPASQRPAPPRRPASLAAQIRKTGRVAVYGIHFAFDKAVITNDSNGVVAEVAKLLRGDPSLRLRIEGHTDNAGDAAYNRELSQRRADAVKADLVDRYSIASNRLSTQGFGPDRPVASNARPEVAIKIAASSSCVFKGVERVKRKRR